ncbi:MAG: response regulator [bacterium]|nr:response regulator [bacterium]MDT8396878.1 response regulator [bacterium]
MSDNPVRKLIALVIDDEEFYRVTMQEALRDEGFRCYTAENGEKGYSLYQRILPDVVVLDRIMPLSGGTRFLMSVRENPNRREAFLVIYSSTLKKESFDESDPTLPGSGFTRILEAPKSMAPLELAPKIRELVTGGAKEV